MSKYIQAKDTEGSTILDNGQPFFVERAVFDRNSDRIYLLGIKQLVAGLTSSRTVWYTYCSPEEELELVAQEASNDL